MIDASRQNPVVWSSSVCAHIGGSAVEDGERRGTREFILDTVEQGYPLTLATGSFVTRVLWDEGAATPTAVSDGSAAPATGWRWR